MHNIEPYRKNNTQKSIKVVIVIFFNHWTHNFEPFIAPFRQIQMLFPRQDAIIDRRGMQNEIFSREDLKNTLWRYAKCDFF